MLKIKESKTQEQKIAESLLPVLIGANKEPEKKNTTKCETEPPLTPDMIHLIIQQKLS